MAKFLKGFYKPPEGSKARPEAASAPGRMGREARHLIVSTGQSMPAARPPSEKVRYGSTKK